MGRTRLRKKEIFVLKEHQNLNKSLIELQKMGFEVCIVAIHKDDNNTLMEGTEKGKLFLQTNNVQSSFATFLKLHKNVASDITGKEQLDERKHEKIAAKSNKQETVAREPELITGTEQAYASETDVDEKYDDTSDDGVKCKTVEDDIDKSENTIDVIDENIEDKNDILEEEENEFMQNGGTDKTKAKQAQNIRFIDFLRNNLNVESTIKSVYRDDGKGGAAILNNYAVKVVKLYDSYKSRIGSDIQLLYEKVCPFCDIPLTMILNLQEHIAKHFTVLESECLGNCDKCYITLPTEYLSFHPCLRKDTSKQHTEMTKSLIDLRDFIAWIEMYVKFSYSTATTLNCHVCDEKTANSEYCFHFLTSHSVFYECNCGEVFRSKDEVDRHMKPLKCDFNDESIERCKDCKLSFSTMEEVEDHLLSVHQMSTEHACEHCGGCFRCRSGISSHRCSKKKKGKYHCHVGSCGEVFTTYNSFLKHGQEKHEITRYLCNICGKKFLMNSRLKSHQEWAHGIGEKVECKVCQKVLNGANTLRSHMLSHNSKELKFTCEICGKLYRYRSSLIQHKNTSHQVKEKEKFKCEVCGMVYTKKVSLTHHIVMTNHIGENQHFAIGKAKKCDQCGKLFGNNLKLKTHTAQVHVKVKSQVCTYCGKSFGDSSTLRQHIQVHTGDRPTCNICNSLFRSQRKLCQHMLETHGMQTEYSKFDPLKYQISQD